MREAIPLDKDEFLEKYPETEAHDGLERNMIEGYFNWRNDGLYFSPSLGPCPFVKMPEGTRVVPNQSYKCPFPFGRNHMWSGSVVLPSAHAMEQLIRELGFRD